MLHLKKIFVIFVLSQVHGLNFVLPGTQSARFLNVAGVEEYLEV